MQNPDFWQLIPTEIACEIISNFTSLRDIIQFSRVSPTFRNLASFCIQEIYSPTFIKLSSKSLNSFKNLRYVEGNIIFTINTIEDLPSDLLKANFIIEDILVNNIPMFFEELLKKLNIGPKVPYEKFIIVIETSNKENIGVVFEGTNYMFIGNWKWIKLPLATMIKIITELYPNLKLVSIDKYIYRIAESIIPTNKLIKSEYMNGVTHINLFKDFFKNVDFGPSDPNNPLSEPVSKYIEFLGNLDLLPNENIRIIYKYLLKIYGYYHKSISLSGSVVIDTTLYQYFNELLNVKLMKSIDIDLFVENLIKDRFKLNELMYMDYTLLYKIYIPFTFTSYDDFRTLSQKLSRTLDYYDRYRYIKMYNLNYY